MTEGRGVGHEKVAWHTAIKRFKMIQNNAIKIVY